MPPLRAAWTASRCPDETAGALRHDRRAESFSAGSDGGRKSPELLAAQSVIPLSARSVAVLRDGWLLLRKRNWSFQSSPLTPSFGFLRLKLRWLRSKVVTL